MKRVLMIIPNVDFGGAQRVFSSLSECLAGEVEVTECVFNMDKRPAYPTKNKLISLDVPAGANVLHKLWCFMLRVKRLRQIKKQYGFHYSISHLEGADYINILSRQQEKVILCVHGSKIYDAQITGWLGWLRRQVLIKFLYRRADHIVAVAEGIKDELVRVMKLQRQRITVINNGFPVHDIRSKTTSLPDPCYEKIFDKPVLITHGRLAPEKDIDVLIDAMAAPAIKGKYKLVIIGDGLLREQHLARAAELKLNIFNHFESAAREITSAHEILFLGFQPNPFSFLSRSSLFVFPSLYEGFPMALGEAMICGLPVVARNCPYGPGEILSPTQFTFTGDVLFGEFGVLIHNDLGSENKLRVWSETIDKMLSNPGLLQRYRVASAKRSAGFDAHFFCGAWKKLLLEIAP